MPDPELHPQPSNTAPSGQSDPERWLGLYGDALFRYALARLHDRTRAEDAVQECLLAALSARSNYRGEAAERTWLFGILKHKIADQFRRASREVSIADDDEAEALIEETFDRNGAWQTRPLAWDEPVAGIERDEFWRMLNRCIEALPATLGTTLQMVEVDELSSEDACKALDISATNLWVRLHRARLKLRDCIERNWFVPGNRRQKKP